jgi:hypothetical protein
MEGKFAADQFPQLWCAGQRDGLPFIHSLLKSHRLNLVAQVSTATGSLLIGNG